MAKKKDNEGNIIASNKKASFKYQLSDHFEAGIVLTGDEIKSLRAKKANLTDSYAIIKNGEAWLINAHIAKYEHAHHINRDPKRPRKLLLHKKEIRKLTGKLTEKGLTLVPTKLYFRGSFAKAELAIAKGRKIFDKRDEIKKRDTQRTMQKAIKFRR